MCRKDVGWHVIICNGGLPPPGNKADRVNPHKQFITGQIHSSRIQLSLRIGLIEFNCFEIAQSNSCPLELSITITN